MIGIVLKIEAPQAVAVALTGATGALPALAGLIRPAAFATFAAIFGIFLQLHAAAAALGGG
jgi:hypothetical protein